LRYSAEALQVGEFGGREMLESKRLTYGVMFDIGRR